MTLITSINIALSMVFLVYILVWWAFGAYGKNITLAPTIILLSIIMVICTIKLFMKFELSTIFSFILWLYNFLYWLIIYINQIKNKKIYNFVFQNESNINQNYR